MKNMAEENKPLTELDELGEFGLIDQLTQDFPLRNASSLKGVGDDAAVINHEGYPPLSRSICSSKASIST